MTPNQKAYQQHYNTVKESLMEYNQGKKTAQQHDHDVNQSRKHFEQALADNAYKPKR